MPRRILQSVEEGCSEARCSRLPDHFDGGVTCYLEVPIASDSLFRAEIAAVVTRRAQLVAIVDLYKALGGGWTVDRP